MAAPSGIVWGSIVGGYGRIGIYVQLTNTNTETTRHTEVWFWSKYTVDDSNNTFYYDDNATTATTNKGSVDINTTVASGDGWSTTNQVKLKEYDYTFTRGTSSSKRYVAAKLKDIDRVGGTMSVSTSYTIPALTKYTVKYNANGGSGAPSSQSKYYGKTLTLSSTKPTRTGYAFKGWATSASGSVVYAAGANYTANASATLYAVWQVNTYTVKYNVNGGSGAPSSQTKTHGVTLTLSSIVPSKASSKDENGTTIYVFKGWAKSANSTTVSYAAGAKYTANESVTLYAVWQARYSSSADVETYTVSYETNGGSNVNAQIKTKGTVITLSTTIPTKTGYTFAGWGLSEDATTVSYAAGATYSTDADVVLYAIWTPWTHTVKYNLNGGTGTVPSSFTKTTDINVLIEEGAISKANCEFKCWCTNANGSGGKNYYVGDAYDAPKNGGTVTLYAIWRDKVILIYPETSACKANEFFENVETLGFRNDGTVHAMEIIESNAISFSNSSFVFSEIIEK